MAFQRAKSIGTTWGPPGSCRSHMGPMLAPWTLLSALLRKYLTNKTLHTEHPKIWRRFDMETVTTLLDLSDGICHKVSVMICICCSPEQVRLPVICDSCVTSLWWFTQAVYTLLYFVVISLQWRHNGRDSVSNQQPHDCFLNRLFRHRSKKISKLRVTGLCAGNSRRPVNSPHKWPVTRKMFPFDDVIMWYQLFCPYPSACIRFQWLQHSQ